MQPAASKPPMPHDHLAQPDDSSVDPEDRRPGSPELPESEDDLPPLATAQGIIFAVALGILIWVSILVFLFS